MKTTAWALYDGTKLIADGRSADPDDAILTEIRANLPPGCRDGSEAAPPPLTAPRTAERGPLVDEILRVLREAAGPLERSRLISRLATMEAVPWRTQVDRQEAEGQVRRALESLRKRGLVRCVDRLWSAVSDE